MTRLTVSEDPGEEFTVRGHNVVTDQDDNEIVFYDDVTKVQVLPEQENFAIQVMTAAFVLEMDFEDADKVLEALGWFETKRVLEVDFSERSSVRITPSDPETRAATGEASGGQSHTTNSPQGPSLVTFQSRGGLEISPDDLRTTSDAASLPITLNPAKTLPSWPSIWSPATPGLT